MLTDSGSFTKGQILRPCPDLTCDPVNVRRAYLPNGNVNISYLLNGDVNIRIEKIGVKAV